MTNLFTSNDLRRVAKRAWKRGHSEGMQKADVEDAIGDILADAVSAAMRTGGSTVALAHMNAKRGRYMTRTIMEAERAGLNYAMGVGSSRTDIGADDFDYAHIASHSVGFVPEDIEAAIDLWDLVRRLPNEHAQAFALHAYFGFTLADTAFLLGTSIATVDRNTRRARASLQESLRTL